MKVKEPKVSSNFSGPQTPSFSLSHSFRFIFFFILWCPRLWILRSDRNPPS